ncbi:hypothetical protein BP5796_10360 [Coleophoma crateriformis]|uniref:HMG box domain-containing protein n=1 Tax=Coleophoma crateriformis TaxID=565419 RepID=A0A3D8QQA2_9HELO|nr:hypothetical protein BP5796_10360 [Coleophoma crateriformis]
MASKTAEQALPLKIFELTSLEERQEFRALWAEHIKLRDQGIIAYFLPKGIVKKMGGKLAVKEVARRLSILHKRAVYVYVDDDLEAFRIGDHIKRCDQFTKVLRMPYPPPQDEHGIKIPKPRNSFIIYRGDKSQGVKALFPELTETERSKIIAEFWRNETAEVKAHYKELAELEKQKILEQNPDYKCTPRKKWEIKRRNKKAATRLEVMSTSPAITAAAQGNSNALPPSQSTSSNIGPALTQARALIAANQP